MKGYKMISINDKNTKIIIDGEEMDYVVFGSGKTPLIMLP